MIEPKQVGVWKWTVSGSLERLLLEESASRSSKRETCGSETFFHEGFGLQKSWISKEDIWIDQKRYIWTTYCTRASQSGHPMSLRTPQAPNGSVLPRGVDAKSLNMFNPWSNRRSSLTATQPHPNKREWQEALVKTVWSSQKGLWGSVLGSLFPHSTPFFKFHMGIHPKIKVRSVSKRFVILHTCCFPYFSFCVLTTYFTFHHYFNSSNWIFFVRVFTFCVFFFSFCVSYNLTWAKEAKAHYPIETSNNKQKMSLKISLVVCNHSWELTSRQATRIFTF